MRTRSLKERFLHALGFETLAILTVAPLAAWSMQKPLFLMGALAIMLSTVAMLWNMIYNTIFDRLCPPGKVHRGLLIRALHALLFEGGYSDWSADCCLDVGYFAVAGVTAGSGVFPVFPALHHGVQLGMGQAAPALVRA